MANDYIVKGTSPNECKYKAWLQISSVNFKNGWHKSAFCYFLSVTISKLQSDSTVLNNAKQKAAKVVATIFRHSFVVSISITIAKQILKALFRKFKRKTKFPPNCKFTAFCWSCYSAVF